MKTHEAVDRRSLALAQAVVDAIDTDPARDGLTKARETCARWQRQSPSLAIAEWLVILRLEWEEIRPILLDPGERGQRLRQSNPFCGVLSPRERWDLYRRFSHEHQAMLSAGVVSEAAVRALAAELDPEQASLLNVKLTICLRRL